MQRFWFSLWLYWAFFLTLLSTLAGLLLAGCVTLGIYLYKGAPGLNGEIAAALYDIWRFWFGVMWSAALPVALLVVIKYLFNRCFSHYRLLLFSCDGSEQIVRAGTGECVKIWRKWLFVIVWAVAAEVLLVAAAATLLGFDAHPSAWFDIYLLYLFVLIAGGVTLPLMASRCKRVKVAPC